jgi:hypothetical protein
MFYTTLGRIVAGLSFGLGILGIVMGLTIATGVVVEPSPGAYVGAKTTGQWIDRGIYMLVFAIILGVLTDISRSVAQLNSRGRSIEERGPLQASAGPGAAGMPRPHPPEREYKPL